MSTKTPEQIAATTFTRLDGTLPTWPMSPADLRKVMVAAIEADRAQRKTATSADDRITTARAALEPDDREFQGIVTKLRTTKGSPFALDVMAAAADRIEALTTALRGMAEPSAIEEDVEKLAMRVCMGIHSFPWLVHGDAMRDLIGRGILAGIQAAWESWEPDDYAPTPEPDYPTKLAINRVRVFTDEHELWEGETSHISTTGEYSTPIRHSLNSGDLRIILDLIDPEGARK